jgi:hypothetical protein
MIAGVPGTGISGLYYVLLVCWMPVREARLLLVRRSSLARWRFIARQLAIVVAIVSVLYGEAICLGYLVEALAALAVATSTPSDGLTAGAGPAATLAAGAPVVEVLAPTLFAITPWLMLLTVILTIQILSRVVPAIDAARPRRAAAEPARSAVRAPSLD